MSPNTLLITVAGSDIINQNILNGPVIYTPIENILDSCVSVSNINLITDADNGTFGFFPPGTPSNTGPEIEPYPNVTPDFTYVVPDPTKFTPLDGEYTVQNIMTNAMSNVIGAWWRIADHTTGNETGRMMVVNGFNPGAVFFKSTVQVTPNTNYLFSTWILNLFKVTGYPPPQLGVRIFDQNNNILYQATLGAQIPVNTNAPEWKEVGTVINSQNNNQLTVEFFSEGESAIGNDYAIDDVSLREIAVPTFTPIKTSNTETANVGDIITYTVTLDNTCDSPLTNVFFRDLIPNGLEFIPGTVTVETVALLSKLDVDKHIDVEIKLDELDLTSAESKATYAQIKEYVLEKFGLKVSTLYIAQIKKKCGIELREHYNKSKKDNQAIPQCTPEKEEAIMDALRHFKMI